MSRRFFPKFVASLGLISGLAVAYAAYAATSSYLYPISDGYYTQWLKYPIFPKGKYLAVDEEPCNGNTDFVYTTSTGFRQTFGVNLSSIPTSTITAIRIVPCASKYSSGLTPSTMSVYYRWNGTDYTTSTVYSLTGTTPVTLATTTFSSYYHSKTSTSTLEIGVRYVSGSSGLKLSNIKAMLDYTAK